MWTNSNGVAASVAATGHKPRLHCMLDVVSSEPVSRGTNVILCFKQKRCAHCARGKVCCKHLAARIARYCHLEEAGMNSLARGTHQFQVSFRFEAMGSALGTTERVLQGPFSNEKKSTFLFCLFLFVHFYSF